MSMLSELVNEMRVIGEEMTVTTFDPKYIQEIILEAADTIKSLSAKLQAANMERSDRYYGGGWIAVDENNLPQGEVLGCNAKGGMAVGKIKKVREGDIRVTDFLGGGLMNCIAYMPLPEPYRP